MGFAWREEGDDEDEEGEDGDPAMHQNIADAQFEKSSQSDRGTRVSDRQSAVDGAGRHSDRRSAVSGASALVKDSKSHVSSAHGQ